jgi:hypothetical protein
VLATALLLGSCGGDDSGGDGGSARLSPAERSELRAAEEGIRDYCRSVRSFLVGEGPRPGRVELEDALRAVDAMVGVARENAEASYRGRTMRQLVGDTAEDLEGTNCGPPLVERLRQGLASIPAS